MILIVTIVLIAKVTLAASLPQIENGGKNWDEAPVQKYLQSPSPIGPGNPGYDPDRTAVPETKKIALLSSIVMLVFGFSRIKRKKRQS